MTSNRQRADFDLDRQLNLALVRLSEIVGGAATRISPEFRRQHPEIPWRQVISLRNRLIHRYDEVDYDVLWDILLHEMPRLVAQLEHLLQEDGS